MADKFFGWIENLLRFLLQHVLKFSISEGRLQAFVEFVKFGVIGLSNTVISYVTYVLFLWGFQRIGLFPKIDYLVAQFVGFVLSVLWSFYWNNKFVFKANNKDRNWLSALMKTYVSYAFTGLFLNSILSVLWVEILEWSKMIAPMINLLISVPLNFILNKFWAFKGK